MSRLVDFTENGRIRGNDVDHGQTCLKKRKMAKLTEKAKLESGRRHVVAAFANHWRGILRNDDDLTNERVSCFLAGSDSARQRLADCFYGRKHVQQMASLSSTEICETLSPWLEHALRYWLDHCGGGDDFLEDLPTAEYVSIVCLHHSGHLMIDRYPGEGVLYDDLYERMLSGVSSGGVLRIYKSTGECFTPSEARSVRAGIRRDLLSGIAESLDTDPWVISMEPEFGWGTRGFEDEDFERVVIVEVNDFRECPDE